MFSYSFSVVHYCCCCCCVASVVSDSVRPHKRQPTRLPHPWDSPGKNTGVGCHFLLQCIKVKVKSLSRVRLFVTPWTAAHQAPLPMGFSRQEYWSGVPLPSLSSYTAFLKYPNNGLFRHSPLPPPKSTCCMELSLVSCHLEQFPSLFTSLS